MNFGPIKSIQLAKTESNMGELVFEKRERGDLKKRQGNRGARRKRAMSHSGPPSEMKAESSPTTIVYEVLRDLMVSEEFRPFQPYEEKLRTRLLGDEELVETVEFLSTRRTNRASLDAGTRIAFSETKTGRLTELIFVFFYGTSLISGLLLAIAFLLPSSIFPFVNNPFLVDILITAVVLGLVLAFVSLLASSAIASLFDYNHRNRRDPNQDMEYAKVESNQAIEITISVALRKLIPIELESEIEFNLSDSAPAMVELENARIIPADSDRYLRKFIGTHEASAIGLAGPRGTGKTTALRLLAQTDQKTVGVYIPAPSRYEPAEFIRHILIEVAESVMGTDESPPVGRSHATLRVVSAIFVVLVASALLIPIFTPINFPLRPAIGWILAIGVFLLYGAERQNRLRQSKLRQELSGFEKSALRAKEMLEDLHFHSAQSSRSMSGISLLSGFLNHSQERAVQKTSMEKTRSDLVRMLRRLLTETHYDTGKRIIIAIDGLDKLSDPREFTGIVNDLKELFHLRGVHFLVSVSSHALDSFDLRGVPGRDVFDSAFDSIYEFGPMRVSQSIDVLRGRSTGFPIPLALFAHAWSGGLPRDLLRCARGCKEASARLGEDKPETARIVQEVLRRDVTKALDAFLRQHASGALEHHLYRNLQEFRSLLDQGSFDVLAIQFQGWSKSLFKNKLVEVAILQRYLSIASLVSQEYAAEAAKIGTWSQLATDQQHLRMSEHLASMKHHVGDILHNPDMYNLRKLPVDDSFAK